MDADRALADLEARAQALEAEAHGLLLLGQELEQRIGHLVPIAAAVAEYVSCVDTYGLRGMIQGDGGSFTALLAYRRLRQAVLDYQVTQAKGGAYDAESADG